MVEVKTERYKQAERREDAGEFDQSSELYVRSAFARLADTGFETTSEGSNTLLAVGDSLRGIYCAIRAGDRKKAESMQMITRGILELLRIQTTNPCLKGVLTEWIGDSYLLIDNPKYAGYYSEAADIYETLSTAEQRNWGAEPEIDHSQWVFEDYVDWRELEAPSTTDLPLQLDFLSRIDFKQEIGRKLTDQNEE